MGIRDRILRLRTGYAGRPFDAHNAHKEVAVPLDSASIFSFAEQWAKAQRRREKGARTADVGAGAAPTRPLICEMSDLR